MSDVENIIREEFDRWSDAGRAESMAKGHHSMTMQCLSLWNLKDKVVLDVGCGNGWAVREMFSQGASVGIGVDLSPKMIAQAHQQKQYTEEYYVANAQTLPLPAEHVDIILSVESLYYYEKPQQALVEWFRVAKPQAQLGIVIDLFWENDGSRQWVDALSIPVHLLSIAEYTKMLLNAGWVDVQHRFFFDHRPAKKESDFTPDPYWPSYEQYLRFRAVGSLCLTAQKS